MFAPISGGSLARAVVELIRLGFGVALLSGLAALGNFAQGGVNLAVPDSMMAAFTPMTPLVLDKTGSVMRVSAINESSIVSSVSRGKTSLAIVCRPLSNAEQHGVEAHLIGYGGIAVIVNGRNPLDNLRTDQLTGIFTQRVRKWNEVGGADKLIVPIMKNVRFIPADMDSYLPPVSSAKKSQIVDADLPAILFVAVDPYAIGYVSITQATKLASEGARIKIIEISGKPPLPEKLHNGEYPLSWPVYLVTGRKLSKAEQHMKSLLLGAEGRQILTEIGIVPAESRAP